MKEYKLKHAWQLVLFDCRIDQRNQRGGIAMSTEETAIKLQTNAKMQIMDNVITACALLKAAEHMAENHKALPELHAIIQNQIENDEQGELEYVFRVAIATLPYSNHVTDKWSKWSKLDQSNNLFDKNNNGIVVEHVIQRR